jgi:hypothetical protein
MKYIITCDDPTDIILGMKAIKALIRDGGLRNSIVACYEFEDGSYWYAKKTKTGYSARKLR